MLDPRMNPDKFIAELAARGSESYKEILAERDSLAQDFKDVNNAFNRTIFERDKLEREMRELKSLSKLLYNALLDVGTLDHDHHECPSYGVQEGDVEGDEVCTCNAWEINKSVAEARKAFQEASEKWTI